MKKILYFLLSASLLAMFGCTGDTNSLTNPNASALTPTGTIQGKLVDACTKAPIQNAIVDIGVAKATTNAAGQYVLSNVPATKQADSSVHGEYSATIDLRKATTPAGAALTNVYPEFAYSDMKVVFTTLNGSGNGQQDGYATANGNNPAVPIVGLVAGDQDIYVGKLAATIKGTVKKHAKPGFVSDPAVGYFVQLVACDCNCNSSNCEAEAGDSNSATGYSGNVVKTTTTGSDGSYTFAGIEAGRKFKVVVTDVNPADSQPTFTGTDKLCAGCDNTVVYAETITTDPVSEATPCLIGVDPAKFSNIAPDANGNVTVTFTFNKEIAANSNNGLLPAGVGNNDAINTLALTSPGNPNSLFAKVDVNWHGFKSSNVAFRLNWLDAKTLQVIIPNASPASIYSVDISRALKHSYYGEADDTAAAIQCGGPCNWPDPTLNATDDCDVCSKVKFYTFGAVTAEAPVVQAINQPYDYNDDIVLSWKNTSGAKGYNVYCQGIQNWFNPAKTETGPFFLAASLTTGTTAEFGGATDLSGWRSLGIQQLTATFIENDVIQITYNCKVKGVNADGSEGADSNIVGPIADTVKPEIIFSTLQQQLANATTEEPMTTFEIYFNEPMDKTVAETVTNYVFDPAGFTTGTTLPTVTAALYDVSQRKVTLTTTPIDPATVNADLINTGPNGINESGTASGNTEVIPFGQGSPNSACVTGAAGPPPADVVSTPAGDDLPNPVVAGTHVINSGPNGICETTITAPDVQTLPVGQGLANQTAITARPTFILFSAAGGDDVVVNNFNVITVNVVDVARNPLEDDDNKIYSNGGIH